MSNQRFGSQPRQKLPSTNIYHLNQFKIPFFMGTPSNISTASRFVAKQVCLEMRIASLGASVKGLALNDNTSILRRYMYFIRWLERYVFNLFNY